MCFIWIEQQSFSCSSDIKANQKQHPQMEDSGNIYKKNFKRTRNNPQYRNGKTQVYSFITTIDLLPMCSVSLNPVKIINLQLLTH